MKHSKTGGPIFLIHKSTHNRTQVRICENVCMFPCYQLHRNWSICANGNICKLWVNGLRYVGAPRTAHDYRTVSSKLQWRELENQGTSLAFQGLRVCASTAGDMDSIPGQRTKIPHATGPKKVKIYKIFFLRMKSSVFSAHTNRPCFPEWPA